MHKVLVIIPARGGSKRIPDKNIKPFFGKPLLAWTIEASKNAKLVNKVVVSSDYDNILDIAKEHGADALKRPDELSTDTSTSESAMLHALEETVKGGFKPDLVILVQATSPLLTSDDIDASIRTMVDGGFPTPVGLLPSPVPEPATIALLAVGGLALMRRTSRIIRCRRK